MLITSELLFSGMGLYEYLVWIEDMGMQPIMGVWDGYTLDGTSQPESALAPYIQDAIDQVRAFPRFILWQWGGCKNNANQPCRLISSSEMHLPINGVSISSSFTTIPK